MLTATKTRDTLFLNTYRQRPPTTHIYFTFSIASTAPVPTVAVTCLLVLCSGGLGHLVWNQQPDQAELFSTKHIISISMMCEQHNFSVQS